MDFVNLLSILAAEGAGDFTNGTNTRGEAGTADVSALLTNGGTSFEQWAAIVVVILGVVALLVGTYMLVSGLISHGKKQTSWIVVILLFVVGGVLLFGGWAGLTGLVGGLNNTVSSWAGAGGGGTTILPLPF